MAEWSTLVALLDSRRAVSAAVVAVVVVVTPIITTPCSTLPSAISSEPPSQAGRRFLYCLRSCGHDLKFRDNQGHERSKIMSMACQLFLADSEPHCAWQSRPMLWKNIRSHPSSVELCETRSRFGAPLLTENCLRFQFATKRWIESCGY